MHLRSLKIHSLPGIEPGFTFEPATDGVNIVTGPNAIGKSSLARALKYLLAGVDRRGDPPDLHLEAEFLGGAGRWTVRRTGRQIVWMLDGEQAAPPALPGADQFGLYRLSVESLLLDDKSDQALADSLWRAVRGGFDLDEARTPHIGPRFAGHEEKTLRLARRAFADVQRQYAYLQDREANLPELAARIDEARQAGVQRQRLETALKLNEAIGVRRACAATLEGFAADLDKLQGNELERLDELDDRAARLSEDLAKAQRARAAAVLQLERTGLHKVRPDPQDVSLAREILRHVAEDALNRDNARDALEQAKFSLDVALAEFKGGGNPPRLDAGSLQRAREIIDPLGDKRVRQRELEQRLAMAGIPPDEAEIDRLRDGATSLRRWLAAQSDGPEEHGPGWVPGVIMTGWWAAATLAAITGFTAVLAGAWWSFGVTVVVAAILVGTLFLARRAGSPASAPGDAARRSFTDTGLESPPTWESDAVREHLRLRVEGPLNRLLLQRERAAGAAKLRADLDRVEGEIGELVARKTALAREVGFDPALSGAPFLRFVTVTEKWDAARTHHANREAALSTIEDRIGENATRVRGLLEPWRPDDAPPFRDSIARSELEALRIAFDALDARLTAAHDAERAIESEQDKVESLHRQLESVSSDQADIFARAGLESGAHPELAQRIDQLEDWRKARRALDLAKNDERRLRDAIADDPSLIEAVERDAVKDLKHELQAASAKADEYTGLIEERARTNALLDTARKSHKLEQAAGEVGRAEEALKDKRDDVLLRAATDVLLNDVENAFKTEREPELLRKARDRFERVTAHDYTLELAGKAGFAARDLRQDVLRPPARLSSGTRMQLLLALRLAWTEVSEQGGESLPLFLDEALTTSDEERFSAMAAALSRLAGSDGRQIFYLSARRQEAALWKLATGTAPSVIDLAEVRFASASAALADLQYEPRPPLPPPDGSDAVSYAGRIGVHLVDPSANAGGIHLFHLLRDDLPLLYRLLEDWRIGTLGQLESLLASDAERSAISDSHVRGRLRQRCQTARSWTDLWRQGRGKPVDRIVLDECPAIAQTFLDGASDLADELNGDGEALVHALRAGRLRHFRKHKIAELEEWLIDNGYIDNAAMLDPGERRRLTLQRVVPPTRKAADDINRVVDWMESAVVS